MIPVKCPGCSILLQVQDQFAGAEGKCKHCGSKVHVPKPTHLPKPTEIPENLRIDSSMVESGPDGPGTASTKRNRRRGRFVLFSAVAAILVLGLGSISVLAMKRSERTDQAAKSSALSKPTTEAVSTDQVASVATFSATGNQAPSGLAQKALPAPALVAGDVYQVSEPTTYEWLDLTRGRYVSNENMIIPVNGYFTVLGKEADFYLVSISDGTNTFRCRIKSKELDGQQLHHFDKQTVLAWQKEQMEAARQEADRIAREQRQRQLDEANAIAIQEAAMAQREQAIAEAEAERAQAELSRTQAEAAQAQARAAEYQARAMAEAQAQQYILNQQQYYLNQQQIMREQEMMRQRMLHDGRFVMIGGQVVNPEAGH